jgi:hypothetical protein
MIGKTIHTDVINRVIVLPNGIQHWLRVELSPQDHNPELLAVDLLYNLGRVQQTIVVEIVELCGIGDYRLPSQDAKSCFFTKNRAVG